MPFSTPLKLRPPAQPMRNACESLASRQLSLLQEPCPPCDSERGPHPPPRPIALRVSPCHVKRGVFYLGGSISSRAAAPWLGEPRRPAELAKSASPRTSSH